MVQPGAGMSCGQMVAIVDDEPEIVEALKMLLSLRGYGVSAHGSAESLLNVLSFASGQMMVRADDGQERPLAAAILDLNLPGTNGTELMLRLRSMSPSLKIVMITAAQVELERALAAGQHGMALLAKPFSIDSLEAALGID